MLELVSTTMEMQMYLARFLSIHTLNRIVDVANFAQTTELPDFALHEVCLSEFSKDTFIFD